MEWLDRLVAIGWVDLAMLAVLALSASIGASRGLVFELLSLVGWVAAWVGGFWLGPFIAPHLPFGAEESWPNTIAGFVVAFLVVLLACKLGARGLSALIAATPLRPVDRLLGAAFGIARGVLVLLLAAIVVGWTPPAASSAAWRESHGAAWLRGLLEEIVPRVWTRPPPSERERSV